MESAAIALLFVMVPCGGGALAELGQRGQYRWRSLGLQELLENLPRRVPMQVVRTHWWTRRVDVARCIGFSGDELMSCWNFASRLSTVLRALHGPLLR
jgi:hypothetical protein